MIKKISVLSFCLILLVSSLSAQRKMETLDRGLVAVKTQEGVFVSWRIYGDEWNDVTYNLYRDGAKINSEPLEVSNYTDVSGTLASNYTVSAIVDGAEQAQSKAVQPLSNQYLEIPMVPRPAGYEVNDATAADLDGDGEYEIIVKRMCQDWSVNAPYYSIFEAYKLDGTLMWELNVGPNIMSSSGVEINIAAFDFDEDGKAEVFLRTSEGTIFGDGTQIGDTDGDGMTNYRWSVLQSPNMEYMNAGPEFLSLVDGETGAELDRVDFIPRGNSTDWGDGYGHRANKFFFGAPYLDGKKPSLFIGRGIYTRTVMRTYDVVNKQLVPRWEFDTNNNPTYFGQGNHNYTVADVDEDGRDEIVWGSMTVDDDGAGLYSTQLGHGDALHVGDLDPFRRGTEIWKCLEESPGFGTALYDGATGEILIHDILGRDCGRAVAANISDDVTGATLWGSTTVFSATTKKPVSAGIYSTNFRIYWDGDLLEEMLDHNWNGAGGEGVIQKSGFGNIFTASGTNSCNWTKGTPTLQADLFGDWREEVIWRTTDNTKIRIYTTVDPTSYRNYTLMHDHQYRQAICWQMCGYNQPPHVSYFLGEREGMTVPPPPMITNGRLVYKGGGTWDKTSSNWLKDGESSMYADGDHVLFDVSGGSDVAVTLSESVAPAALTVNSPGNYTLNVSEGKLSGTMKLVKQGLGTFTLNGMHDFSGKTEVWNGRLSLNGDFINSPVWMNVFAELDAKGQLQKGVTMRYGSSLYVGGENVFGNLEVSDSLNLENKSELVFDLHSSTETPNDTLKINGDINLADGVAIRVLPHLVEGETALASGSYVIAKVTGSINCNVEKIALTGISGTPASLEIQGDSIVMVIKETRPAASVKWNGSHSNVWDLVTTTNFLNDVEEDVFVTGDDVEINDNALEKNISISEEVSPNSVTVNNTADISFSGQGSIAGSARLTKQGSGNLTISNNNTFTGKVAINEGTVSVSALPNKLSPGSPFGPVTDNGSLFEISGGALAVTSAVTMDRAMSVGANGGTVINNDVLNLNGKITGGALTKSGSGEMVVASANTNSELVIKGGSVRLYNEEASPGNTVSFENGTLVCYDNMYTYSASNYALKVPEGKTGKIYLDGRCAYWGALTGAGTLNVYIPYVRSDFNGNWSAFSGTINISSTKGGDVPCRFNNSYGYANAIVNINKPVYAEHLSGGTVKIGALRGTGTMGNATWELGGRNEDFLFSGSFFSGSIKKVGTGTMTLTGASTNSGVTNIVNGTLVVRNSLGSATGAGSVYVQRGAFLGGYGTIGGSVLVQSGGTLYAGNPGNIGLSLKVKSVMMAAGSNFHVRVNGGTSTSDRIIVSDSFTANGQLIMENALSGEYAAGRSYQIVSSPVITGSFESISPETPGDGLVWDTSEFNSTGTIKVALATGLVNRTQVEELRFYPNPSQGTLFVNLPPGSGEVNVEFVSFNGMVLKNTVYDNMPPIELDLSAYDPGVYIIRVIFDNRVMTGKVILE